MGVVYGEIMKITVVGLGYVGLPLAVAFAEVGYEVIGVDANPKRIDELRGGYDRTGEISKERLSSVDIKFTTNISDASGSDFFIIAVPTPVDEHHVPDLSLVTKASESVGKAISKGAIVILESTVYPGVTEEIVGPTIEKVSGLRAGIDFKLAYSPERVNPGDKVHTLKTITKVVSGQDEETLNKVADLYSKIVDKVFKAESIKVAEASKVVENTQRDVNIALMNEFAIAFDRMGISIWDVLDAASTKWNFLKFTPGLVGGHCIPVDPYYLIYRARSYGFHPQIMSSARRVSDSMVDCLLLKIMGALNEFGKPVKDSNILFLGITFKENVPDMRNSLNFKLAEKLISMGANVTLVDPHADVKDVHREIPSGRWDVVVLAVPHNEFRHKIDMISELDTPIFVDIKGILRHKKGKFRVYITM